MAAVQLHRSLTETRTIIDQKQSLEVVQTMLHGGLSFLTYMRGLFTDRVYDKRYYDTNEGGHSYQEYAAGKLPKARQPSGNGGILNMQILRRGRSKRVDMFLDWLENGAFEALRAGHLRALQVYIHPDVDSRDKILERYTFTISYTHHGPSQKTPTGLRLDSPGQACVSVQATSNALRAMLCDLSQVGNVLPALPAKRYISLELFYTEEAEQYNPRGFVPGLATKMLPAMADGWEQRTESFPELQTSFHSSSLKVSTLRPIPGGPETCIKDLQFPETLAYSNGIARQQDMDDETPPRNMTPSLELTASRSRTPSTSSPDALPTASTYLADEPDTGHHASTPLASVAPEVHAVTPRRNGFETAPHGLGEHTRASNFRLSLTQNSICSDGREMNAALVNMLRPEHISQGDTQSQYLPPPPTFPSAPITKISGSPGTMTSSPLGSYTGSPVHITKPALSQYRAEGLKRNANKLREQAHQHAQSMSTRSRDQLEADLVDCGCGHTGEEGDMVNCVYCDTWQHLHCYGFTNSEDPRLPDEHTCYKCLLGEEEPSVSKKLNDLSLTRRAMHFAMKNGVTTQQQFAKDTGFTSWRARQLFMELKQAHYIVKASDWVSNAPKSGYVAIQDGPDHDRMLQELFDPMMHIAHHYNVPGMYEASLDETLLAAQRRSMPPPATPASKLRPKKDDGATPGSTLDLRQPQLPFKTPSRTSSRQMQPSKRSLDQGEKVEMASKRQVTPRGYMAKYRSVQTELVLDASGLPSSPVPL